MLLDYLVTYYFVVAVLRLPPVLGLGIFHIGDVVSNISYPKTIIIGRIPPKVGCVLRVV